MKVTIDVEFGELDDDDTICGYRVKDVCLVAKCMEKDGITRHDVAKFVKAFENGAELARKEYEEAFRKSIMVNHINYPFGGEE